MKEKMRLKEKDRQALEEFKAMVLKEFSGAKVILFGSKVDGRDNEASDIDVLVVLDRELNTALEKKIFDIGFEVGLKFEVVFGIMVEEKKFWNSMLARAMPFYQNVAQKGVVL